MRKEIQVYLDEHTDQKLFIRLHPEWYRRLSRDPGQLKNLKSAADVFYGRTFQQRVDRFNEQAGLFSMLMSMVQAMGNSQGGNG
ncbi:MAG: YlbE-like family protein [Sporolactobacillus sp.]